MAGVVVLLSGGVDSLTLAAYAEHEGLLRAAVFVDYGQPAVEQERRAAQRWQARVGKPLFGYTVSGVPLATMADPEGAEGPRVVPARNAVLSSLAASRAAAVGADVVWFGATADDHADYPDCRPAWVDAMSRMLELAYGVRVAAPFGHLVKREVVALAHRLGVPTEEAWSCYTPTDSGEPCGTCNSCVAVTAAA